MSIIIRILPMDKINEFGGDKIEIVQSKFFLNDVPSRFINGEQGIYCFKTNKIKLDDNEKYILFQFDNHIIACAKLNKTLFNDSCKLYQGYYVLSPETICIFDKISLNDLNTFVFPQNPIKRFSQVCHKRNLENIESFLYNSSVIKNLKWVTFSSLNIKPNFKCCD